MGDYNGVGPEVILKSLASPKVQKICRPVLIGSIDVFAWYAERLRLKANLGEFDGRVDPGKHYPVFNLHPFEVPNIQPGKQTVHAGRWAGESVAAAVHLCNAGIFDGMVTAPVSKTTMVKAGFHYPGQTELVASLSGKSRPTMMLLAGNFRMALATVHFPLKKVASRISRGLIADRLTSLDHTLRNDFRIRKPKIAVLGLNPHAGEFGMLGNEEMRFISPAIRNVVKKGIRAEGPFPADGFFGMQMHHEYDAILAMYHDQGLIPLKMSGFHLGVNFSSGLPVVRTSPDHGTAFAIAGKGRANPGSMIEAIKLAVTIIHNRNKAR
jgi:4-hydroxythreonine-4-phosphate dehydrogenase